LGVIFKFQSVPVTETGDADTTDIRSHEVHLAPSKIYVMPAWVGLWTLILSTLVTWGVCVWLRRHGYLFSLNGEERLLSLILGTGLGGTSFLSSVDAEIKFGMLMKALSDRDCDWGEYRVFDRKRVGAGADLPVLKRIRLAFSPHVRG
jgi:hypothetical protein